MCLSNCEPTCVRGRQRDTTSQHHYITSPFLAQLLINQLLPDKQTNKLTNTTAQQPSICESNVTGHCQLDKLHTCYTGSWHTFQYFMKKTIHYYWQGGKEHEKHTVLRSVIYRYHRSLEGGTKYCMRVRMQYFISPRGR